LGKKLNDGFMEIVYAQNPELKKEVEDRIQQPTGLIFFVRNSPILPVAISNFLFASLKIPLKKVILAGIPGMLPRTLMAFSAGMIANSFIGAKESLQQPLQWGVLIFFFLVSVVGIYINLKKRLR
jgi:uncharacterized membrane protein YdjX (TVP38/TMEM64 family)